MSETEQAFGTPQQRAASLRDSKLVEQAIAYLQVKNELSDTEALTLHATALRQINEFNRLKAEAAANEDFELAILYKKKIAEHEKSLMTESTFVDQFWNRKPLLTLEGLLLKAADLDPAFTKNLLDQGFTKLTEKHRVASQLLCL